MGGEVCIDFDFVAAVGFSQVCLLRHQRPRTKSFQDTQDPRSWKASLAKDKKRTLAADGVAGGCR